MDGRTIRIIAFCFVFLGTFLTLIGLIPNQFAVSTGNPEFDRNRVPDEWNGIELARYNLTAAWAVDVTNSDYDWADGSVGGRNLRFYVARNALTNERYIMLAHRYGAGLIFEEALNWYNRQGLLKSALTAGGVAALWEDQIDEDFITYGNMEFTAICKGDGFPGGSSYFQLTVLFYFDSTTYALPSDAWDNSALDALIGITWDYVSSAKDAWFVISSLLSFNTLEVFGATGPEITAVNLILVLPILICIVLPAALFFLEVLDRLLPF